MVTLGSRVPGCEWPGFLGWEGGGGVKFGRMVAGSHWCNINVWEGSIGNRLIRCSTV